MKTRLHLTPGDRGRELSLEEFLEADYEGGAKYELIEGRLDVSPEARYSHFELQEWLYLALRDYARSRPEVINRVGFGSRVFVPSLPARTTAPEPDVAAYHNFPLDRPASEIDWQDVSPALVVEVISPDTADKDLVRNRRLYLRVPSIQEYWMLDTRASEDHPSLIALRRRGTRWARPVTTPPGGTYATPLLPGLTLVVAPRPAAQSVQ